MSYQGGIKKSTKRSTRKPARRAPARRAPARRAPPKRRPSSSLPVALAVNKPSSVAPKPRQQRVREAAKDLGVMIPETPKESWWEKPLKSIGKVGLDLLSSYATDAYNTRRAIEKSKTDF